jgi:thiol-disulfide isomerase/thioredoxin
VEPLDAGEASPSIPGVALDDPVLLFFYKVTCPVCKLAAPVAERLQQAYPGRVVGVGQDDPEALRTFAQDFGVSFDSVQDPPPYPASDAYGVRSVPTLFLVDGGDVLDVVESWDRDGYNRLSHGLAELIGADASTVSTPDDGLPPFRPG